MDYMRVGADIAAACPAYDSFTGKEIEGKYSELLLISAAFYGYRGRLQGTCSA